MNYLFCILKKVKTNTVLILPGMDCVWLVNWTLKSGLQRPVSDTTLTGSKETRELSELKLPSSNFQHCTLGPSEAQQGISAPTFLLLSQDMEPDISKVDALQRNYMNTTHIHPFLFCWIILLSVPPGMPGGYSSCKTSYSEMLFSMDCQSLDPECPLGTSGCDVSPAITKEALS